MAFWKTVGSLYCSLQLTRNTPDYTKLFLSRALHSVKGKCFIVSVGRSRCIEERSKKKRTNWLAKTEHLWGFVAENLFVFQPLWWCNLQSERTAVTWKIWYLLYRVLPASSKAAVLQPCSVIAAVSWAGIQSSALQTLGFPFVFVLVWLPLLRHSQSCRMSDHPCWLRQCWSQRAHPHHTGELAAHVLGQPHRVPLAGDTVPTAAELQQGPLMLGYFSRTDTCPCPYGNASKGDIGVSISLEVAVCFSNVSQWPPLNCTFMAQSTHGGHQQDCSGMAPGLHPAWTSSCWLLLPLGCSSLKESKEWKCPVWISGPWHWHFPLCFHVPLVLHCLLLQLWSERLQVPPKHPDLHSPPWAVLFILFYMYVSLWEIRFSLVRLSMCLCTHLGE